MSIVVENLHSVGNKCRIADDNALSSADQYVVPNIAAAPYRYGAIGLVSYDSPNDRLGFYYHGFGGIEVDQSGCDR